MPESELASGGAPSEPASGGPSVPWALVEEACAGGSPVASAVSSANPSLEAVRAMQCVSSRLRPVPEQRQIDTTALPDRGALAEARRELEECLAFCLDLDQATADMEELALGATACPEGGQVVPAPTVGGDIERVSAMISGAESRLGAAKAEVARLTAKLATGGDDLPASGGGGGDPAHWRAGFEAAPPADWQDRSAPCVMSLGVVLNFESFISL